MKHPSEEELVSYHYGDDGKAFQKEVEQHLAACASCRASYASLEQVLARLDSLPVPERPESYGAEVWQRLRPQLPARRESWWAAWFTAPRWARAGAMAGLLVVAFLAGRYWQPRQAPPMAAISPQVRERILLLAVGGHLDRSEMLLVELVNAEGKGSTNINAEKHRAEDLVASNRLYRQAALRSGDTGMANVLDELERTLLRIAHSPSSLTPAELDQLRRRIEAQGIVFKVRVISSQVREKEKASVREPARNAL